MMRGTRLGFALRQLSLLAIVVSVALLSAVPGSTGSRFVMFQQVNWTCTACSETVATNLSLVCNDDFAFFSKEVTLNETVDAVGYEKDTIYTGLTPLEYAFQPNNFALLHPSGHVTCSLSFNLSSTQYDTSTDDKCIFDGTELLGYDTAGCCTVEFDDGVSATHCITTRAQDGAVCAFDEECSSGSCRGGRCCNVLGQSDGCLKCGTQGSCIQCASPFFLHQRRRRAAPQSYIPFLLVSEHTGNETLNFTNPANATDLNVTTLDAGRCYRDQEPGFTCAAVSQCDTNVCKGGFCCGEGGTDSVCTLCNENGTCSLCIPGWAVNEGQCTQLQLNGEACAIDSDCASGSCRNNKCCGAKGRSEGCVSCDFDGECDECSANFKLIQFECFDAISPGASGAATRAPLTNSVIVAASIGGAFAFVVLVVIVASFIRVRRATASIADSS
eukprot:m.301946 g.301946  ORF g.301946 m.301946 type:complete len:443 (-) comp15884_c0_seq1:139-1467(-)